MLLETNHARLPRALDLQRTMESGQTPTFTWRRESENAYRKLDGNGMLTLAEGKLSLAPQFKRQSLEMLRAQDDLQKIFAKLAEDDAVMAGATSAFPGLRLTKSDAWETTASFIASQNNNIPRIKKIVAGLHANGGFLQPEEILAANLAPLKMGYREKYLKATAEMIARNGFSLEKLARLPTAEARLQLLQLPGVGPKVADCIMLYGLGKTDAFPLDVWVARAMKERYGVESKGAQAFAERKWGSLAGYAQQLLFERARTTTESVLSNRTA